MIASPSPLLRLPAIVLLYAQSCLSTLNTCNYVSSSRTWKQLSWISGLLVTWHVHVLGFVHFVIRLLIFLSDCIHIVLSVLGPCWCMSNRVVPKHTYSNSVRARERARSAHTTQTSWTLCASRAWAQYGWPSVSALKDDQGWWVSHLRLFLHSLS